MSSLTHGITFALTCLLLTTTACNPVKKNSFVQVAPQCLPSQSRCFVDTNYGKFDVLFNTEKVLTELPFEISLKYAAKREDSTEKYSVTTVSGYLEGRDMFMGKVPVMFSQSTPNIFSANALIGSCSEEKMVWRLWLSIELQVLSATGKESDVIKQGFYIDFQSSRF
jgi:hypothetical protein